MKPAEVLRQTTLTFLFRPSSLIAGSREVLLAMKKRGFGVGKWNGSDLSYFVLGNFGYKFFDVIVQGCH
jgi:hypothetical protein